MNRFLLLSLIFFNPFVFFGQLNTSNLSNEMPHVVKTESIEYFEVKKRFGKIKYENQIWDFFIGETQYNEYNEKGQKVLSLDYYPSGEIEYTWCWEYNEKGLLNVLTWYEGSQKNKTLYHYYNYFYDSLGYNMRDSAYNPNGSIYLITNAYTNNLGHDTLDVCSYLDGSILYSNRRTYDELGRQTGSYFLDSEGEEDGSIIYEYNLDGWDEISTQYESLEDSTGQVIYWQYKEIFNEKGDIIKVYEYSIDYEIASNPIWESEIIEMDIKYEYNEYGDWIKQYFYQKGKLSHVAVRTLTYY